MRICLLLVIALFFPAAGTSAEKKTRKKRGVELPGYVKVEIKGKLVIGKKIATNWGRIGWLADTARIVAPGNYDAAHPGFNLKKISPRFGKGPDDAGLAWYLFFGDNKKLYKLANKLNGKTVVVTGTLLVRDPNGINAPVPPTLLVKVASFKLAPEER